MYKTLYLPVVLLSLATLTYAQTTHQELYWIRYHNQLRFSEKTFWVNEVDERRFFNPDKQAQFIVHSHLHYQYKKNLQIATGLTFSSVTSPKENNLQIPEWRIFQEIIWGIPIQKKLNFQFKTRMDERFIHNNNQESLQEGYFFVFRLRPRVQFQYSMRVTSNKNILVRLSDEYMIQFSKTDIPLFDQNRIYIGAEYPWSKQISTELGYMKIHQNRRSGGLFNRDVIRFTFYHRIERSKDNK